MSVAVVIPAYRAQDRLPGVLARIGHEVDQIFVVDDGCPNGTGRRVERECHDPRVRVLYHHVNQGVGGAVMTGMQAALDAGAECVVKIDADGQHDPSLLPALVLPIARGEADYVKGNRFYWLEDVRTMPLQRLLGNIALSFFTKLSSGYWNIFDPTNGYVAIHSAVLRQLPMYKVDRRYFFESDMLFWLNNARARIEEVPMPAIYAGESSGMRPTLQILKFLGRHLRNTGRRLLYSYILRNFSIASLYLLVGVPMFVFGFIDAMVVWWENYGDGKSAPIGEVIIPTLLLLVGVQLITGFLAADVAGVPRDPIHPRLVRLAQVVPRTHAPRGAPAARPQSRAVGGTPAGAMADSQVLP